MGDVATLILQAWDRILPRLDLDPDEIRARLARRRSDMMRRPPRGWCLGVRASDQRINPASAACVPEEAAYPKQLVVGNHFYERHEVTLDARLLRWICRPTYFPGPSMTQREVAAELGCNPCNLNTSIKRGVFSVRHVKGLGGARGRPVPMLSHPKLMDTSAKLFAMSDVLWGASWNYVSDRIPNDLEQTIERVPAFQGVSPGLISVGRRAKFSGWRWVCPGCKQTRRTLFYPLPPLHGVTLLGRDLDPRFIEHDSDARERPLNGFACARCHNILYFSRVNADAWNHLISHLSGGLLYGHEVPRPDWYKEERKRPFRPLLNKRPSRRDRQVWGAMRAGMTYEEIALRLRLSKSTVATYAKRAFRKEAVRNKEELMEKWGRGNDESEMTQVDVENATRPALI